MPHGNHLDYEQCRAVGAHTFSRLAGLRSKLLERPPKVGAVVQYAGVGQLMQNDVVNAFPRQLHQEDIEHDIAALVTAAPAALHPLHREASVRDTMVGRQFGETLAEQRGGLSFQRPPARAARCRLYDVTGRTQCWIVRNNNFRLPDACFHLSDSAIWKECQTVRFTNVRAMREQAGGRAALCLYPRTFRLGERDTGLVGSPCWYRDAYTAVRCYTEADIAAAAPLVYLDGADTINTEFFVGHTGGPPINGS